MACTKSWRCLQCTSGEPLGEIEQSQAQAKPDKKKKKNAKKSKSTPQADEPRHAEKERDVGDDVHDGEPVLLECTEICNCHKPIAHIGQDEAIYCVSALSNKTWSVDGAVHLRPKDGALGVMMSFWVSEMLGFGCQLTPEQLEKVNAQRKIDSPHLAGFIAPYPGIDHLHYGKNKEGYWTSVEFIQQVRFQLIHQIQSTT
jgi:hypothetical protein